ncbi:MAG: hypothetical protein QOJ47_1302, partial [Gaiellales bacterium]|nr:hypothetical protein [Gaiellales bacterium]
PAYAETVGPVRTVLPESDGAQPGDPAKAAEAIIAALDAAETPLRLPLGNDAADAIADHLDRELGEFHAWETVSRSTDVDP